ncbi:MAG: L-rhamnose mutarotase [Verrucomicrobiota bacterium]|jgi:L-rhamnose mutarotase
MKNNTPQLTRLARFDANVNARRIGLTAELTTMQMATVARMNMANPAAPVLAGIAADLKAGGVQDASVFQARLSGQDYLFAQGQAEGCVGNVGFPALESFIERLVMLVCVEAEEIFRMEGAAEYASAQQGRSMAMVTELCPEMEFTYRTSHASPWPAVFEQAIWAGIRDYSIFIQELTGHLFLFSHFRHVWGDWDKDESQMEKSAASRRWWKLAGECICAFPEAAATGRQWNEMRSFSEMRR